MKVKNLNIEIIQLYLYVHQESLDGYQPETKLKGGKSMRTFSQIKWKPPTSS